MATNNDDDEDYMSATFVEDSKDVRPSLLFSRRTKRQHEQERKVYAKNKRFSMKSRVEMEREQREEGLSKELGTDNKGFALMMKMGYKEGSCLGRGSDGRTEPIEINIKSDRGGLGREQFLANKRKEIVAMKAKLFERRKSATALNENSFRRLQQQKLLDKQTQRDLSQSQKSCRQLDQKMDMSEPAEAWFWPPQPKTSEEEHDEAEEEETPQLQPSEMLEILTSYLRSTHNFCIWCGIAFQDDGDLRANCPGNTADCH